MPRVRYSRLSPYFLSKQENTYLSYYVHRKIGPLSTDINYTVPNKYHERPDLAAKELYGNERLYWVFMFRNMNKIQDPIFDFYSGLQIKIPTLDSLRQRL